MQMRREKRTRAFGGKQIDGADFHTRVVKQMEMLAALEQLFPYNCIYSRESG